MAMKTIVALPGNDIERVVTLARTTGIVL